MHHGDRVRVIDLETAGNGPNDVCEIGWQDVVLDSAGRWHVNDERGALLVNPGRPISAETMAVHHILDAHVAGCDAVESGGLHCVASEWQRCCPGCPSSGVRAALLHWVDAAKLSRRISRCKSMESRHIILGVLSGIEPWLGQNV
jgi:hypothetical protein